jgi:hypothetical protein
MKKIIKYSVQILALSFLLSVSYTSTAGPPPPPPGGGGSGGTHDQRTGGANIGSGIFIMLALGAAYGSRKLWSRMKSDSIDSLKI